MGAARWRSSVPAFPLTIGSAGEIFSGTTFLIIESEMFGQPTL